MLWDFRPCWHRLHRALFDNDDLMDSISCLDKGGRWRLDGYERDDDEIRTDICSLSC